MVPGQLKFTPAFAKFTGNKCLYTREDEVRIDANQLFNAIVEHIVQLAKGKG